MDEVPLWVTVVLAIIGSTGLSSVIIAVLQHHWSKKDKKDDRLDKIEAQLGVLIAAERDERLSNIEDKIEALTEAERVVMEERIRRLVSKAYQRGEISTHEKANLKDMHKRYVGIGGNGNLDTEMDLLETIPVEG